MGWLPTWLTRSGVVSFRRGGVVSCRRGGVVTCRRGVVVVIIRAVDVLGVVGVNSVVLVVAAISLIVLVVALSRCVLGEDSGFLGVAVRIIVGISHLVNSLSAPESASCSHSGKDNNCVFHWFLILNQNPDLCF